MRIGLCWNQPDDWIARELCPQVTKRSCEPAPARDDHGAGIAREIREGLDARGFEDCELVVDLRTVSVQDFLAHPLRADGADPFGWFVDWVGQVVEATEGRVRDWELWGEASCPYTGKGFVEADGRELYEGMTYARLLSRVTERIRELDPAARVLLGGHGCDMLLRFYEQIMEAGCAPHFDVNNLHPFALRTRGGDAIEAMLEHGFDRMDAICAAQGVDPHPMAATEFGFPVRDGEAEVGFESDVIRHVVPVGEQQAAEWTDRCLNLFERRGMEYVMLLQAPVGSTGNHWGKSLGIVGRNGQKREALWRVVGTWIAKGRGTDAARSDVETVTC